MLGGTRIRLTLIHTAVLALAILAADAGVFLALTSAERGSADEVLRSQAATIASGIEDVNGQVRFGGGDLPTETQQGIAVDAVLVARDGSISSPATQPVPATALRTLAVQARAAAEPVFSSVTDSHGVHRRLYAERLQAGQGAATVLVVSRSLGELDATVTRTLVALAAFSLLVVAAGSLLAHRLTGRVLLPVRQIASTARSLSEHDLHRRVDLPMPADELGELVATFNAMLGRLENSFDSLRRFTADASHELRSPLALMRSELEGALSRPRTVAAYQQVIGGLQGEVDRMARMVDHMLMLARADAGALEPVRQDVDVADILHEVGARWSSRAAERGVDIDVQAPEVGTVVADPDLVRRVLDNLLDNAIRHSPPGGTVRLSGARGRSGWHLRVADQGPGLPAEARDQLFERFVRTDPARGREDGGAGLGLALSRAIAAAHGGTLELAGDTTAGAAFQLFLPDSRALGSV